MTRRLNESTEGYDQACLSGLALSKWFTDEMQPHETALRNWLRVRFPAINDHDDLVQESFLRVWRARSQGPIASSKAFLFATARNLALDTLQSRLPETDSLDSGVTTVLDERCNIVETVARTQELEILDKALRSLPDRCRQVFTLRRLYGLSQKEIAARLRISEKTVEAQNSIAMHKCVQFFAQRDIRSARTTSVSPVIGSASVTPAPQHA